MLPVEQLAPVLTLRGDRRLVVGSEIGRGTRASVHIARIEQVLNVTPAGEEIMARTIALKIIDPALTRDPETMHELTRSVRRSALVRHANVVAVTDFFVATLGEAVASEPVPCVVEELVDGMSLAQFVGLHEAAGRRMPLDLALFIGCEIAEGLAGARGATSIDGVILNMAHHNLSPRQVLLSWNGEVKVGDFGWRPAGGVVSGVRRTDRSVRDQLLYMAPEVARGGRGDGRADVFSLGVILHEMFYGPRFRHAPSARQALELVRDGVVDRPVTAPILPDEIGAIVARALSPDPRERQTHAGIVAYDLRRAALGLGVADGRMFLRSAMFDMAEGARD